MKLLSYAIFSHILLGVGQIHQVKLTEHFSGGSGGPLVHKGHIRGPLGVALDAPVHDLHLEVEWLCAKEMLCGGVDLNLISFEFSAFLILG